MRDFSSLSSGGGACLIKSSRSVALFSLVLLAGGSGINPAHAASLSVPNSSFESPATLYVDVNVGSWQKAPKPAWYAEAGGFLWTQLTGTFKNSAPGSFDHIENCEGAQGLWLFAVPESGLFQDYESQDANSPAPTHEFNATFKVGRTYALTVGVIGGGGGMSNGAPIELSLYYRDAASNRVQIASTQVTHSPAVFPDRNHFVDFHVEVPTVKATDPWAGEHIGIGILSTVTTNLQGGYWDLDNVRLAESSAPVLAAAMLIDGTCRITLQSDPGRFEILASTNLALPLAAWSSIGLLTNTAANASITDPETNLLQRFYIARELP